LLKLRKILLCNFLYISIFIIVIILTIIRLNIPNTSKLKYNTKSFTGTVDKIIKKNNKTTIYIKNKEIVVASIYKKININLGDRITIYGKFNYNDKLKYKNIFYYANIYNYKILSKNKNIYYFFKQKLINSFNNNPYLYTFILGDKSYLKKDVVRSYQDNGISHLFAISGMHISLLVSIINKLIKRFNEYNRFKITSIILVIYLLLVGFSPSILRGVLFYLFFSINNIYYFYIKKINLCLLIISIALLINPNYVYDIGFIYSYSISISLIIFSNYLKGNYFISLLKVSLIASLVSLPITLYNYCQINLLSVVYNLFFVPFISIIIFPLTLIVLIIKPLEPIYNLLINILEEISLFLNNINIFKITFMKLNILVYIIYFIIVFIFLFRVKKIYLYILSSLLIIHLLLPNFSSDYVYFLDVDQGDSFIIHENNKNIMIDTGGNNNELFHNTLNPKFKELGIRKIDYLILSHGDYDHMGEAINLVNNFKVEKVIFNCGEYNDLEKELIKELNKKKIKYYSCIKELNVDNNKLYFLQTKEYGNENDNSNVIYTELNGYKFMFMGDAGIEKEKDILNKYNISDIDVLKVGHHGSKTSSSEYFINEINSKYSIISVGKNNRYGHPNKEVLENLQDSKIYRTDQDGSIMFKIKNNKLKIETCNP